MINNINIKKQLKKISKINIPFIIFKGVFINDLFATKNYYKASGDIDIYVRKEDLKDFCIGMRKLGYEPDWSEDTAINYIEQKDYITFGGNHLPNFKNNNLLDLAIEIHFSVATNYYGDFGSNCVNSSMEDLDLFKHTKIKEYENVQFNVLNPTYQFLILLLHYFTHIKVYLHAFLNQHDPAKVYSHLLQELSIYYYEYKNEIDIDEIFNVAIKYQRFYEVLLPLKLLNYYYKTNIQINYKAEYNINEKQSVIGKYLLDIVNIKEELWTEENFGFAVKEILSTKLNNKIIYVQNNQAEFNIQTLIGIRYNQYVQNKEKNGKIIFGDELKFCFYNIDLETIKQDREKYKDLSPEKGEVGIYLSFFFLHNDLNQDIKNTYLLKFNDENACLLGFENKEYEKVYNIKFEINKNKDKYNISFILPKELTAVYKHKNNLGFMAYLGGYEPYFHLNNILDMDIYKK